MQIRLKKDQKQKVREFVEISGVKCASTVALVHMVEACVPSLVVDHTHSATSCPPLCINPFEPRGMRGDSQQHRSGTNRQSP